MGQTTVILVLAALLTGGILLWNARGATQDARDATTVYHTDQFGREVAAVGLEQVARRLAAEPDLWDTLATTGGATYFDIPTTTYDTDIVHGTYAVEVTSYTGTAPAPFPTGPITDPERVTVVSTGTFEGTPYTIRATYEKGWTDIGVPPAYRYAMMSELLFRFNGQGEVKSASGTTNADIHSNSNMSLASGSRIEGYGTWVGSGPYPPTQFFPNISDGSGTYGHQSSYIDIPPFNPTDYLTSPLGPPDEYGPTTISPSNTVWGNASRGPNDPYLIYINGNLGINQDLRIEGNAIIVVNGNLTTQGHRVVKATTAIPPSHSASDAAWITWVNQNLNADGSDKVTWLVGGNITLGGTISMVGKMFTNGDFTLGGGGLGQNLVGGVTSRGKITLNGGGNQRNIWYTGISEGSSLPGGNYLVPTGLRLVDYSEWPDLS